MLRDEPLKGLDEGIGLPGSRAGLEAKALMMINAMIDALLRLLRGLNRRTQWVKRHEPQLLLQVDRQVAMAAVLIPLAKACLH